MRTANCNDTISVNHPCARKNDNYEAEIVDSHVERASAVRVIAMICECVPFIEAMDED